LSGSIEAFDFRKLIGNTFFIRSSLNDIASSQVIYSSIVNTVKEEVVNESFFLYNIDGITTIDFHTTGFVELVFVYGIIGYFFLYHMETIQSMNTKLEKLDHFVKYYQYRKMIRYVLFFLLFVSTKNIENAI